MVMTMALYRIGNQPFPEQVITIINDAKWDHQATMS